MINKNNIIKENQRKTLYDPNLAEYLNKKVEEEKRRRELEKKLGKGIEEIGENLEKKIEDMGKIIGLKEVGREKYPHWASEVALGPVGNWVNGVCFSPDGRYIATGSQDKYLRIFKIINNPDKIELNLKPILRKDHPNSVHKVSFSPDGRYIATGCLDEHLRIFEIIREKYKNLPLYNNKKSKDL
mgnify:FL=1